METPAGVVDTVRVRRNAEAMAGYAAEHGLRWRPHVKTHKSTEVAGIQLAAGANGLTVATLREAEVMAHRCDDVLLAYPPVGPAPLDRAMAVAARTRLTVALDGAPALEGLAERAEAEGLRVGVLVELDAGMRRMGVRAPEEAVRLAERAAELDGVSFDGLLFYPGHVRVPLDRQGEALRELGKTVAGHRDALERRGLAASVVSGGSTPTLWRSHEVAGVTEIRPGMGIFHDRDMVALGVARPEEVGYAVLATVVSTALPGQAVVDAGSKALAKEELRSAERGGYGYVLEHPGVVVDRVSEEHGVLDLSGTEWRPAVGDRVRIVPNHVCVSVNLQDGLWAGEGVLDESPLEPDGLEWWSLEARGRGPAAPGDPRDHDDG